MLEKLFKSHLPKELYIQVTLNYSYALFQNNEVEKFKRIIYELYESQNREAFETENLYQLAQLLFFLQDYEKYVKTIISYLFMVTFPAIFIPYNNLEKTKKQKKDKKL